MLVLVTGACGFLGRNLVPKLLEHGYQVVAVDRNPNPDLKVMAYYQGDICRSDILEKIENNIDTIIHLAADVDICSGYDCMVDNVYGTFVLSQWAKRRAIRKFIYPSTIGIYDASKDGEKANESYPVLPPSLYGMSKYLGECCLSASGIHALVLRFSYIYGPGDLNSAIANIIRSVLNGQTPKIRNERRDYLHVDDAITAFLKALDYDGQESVFNIGSGVLTEMTEIVRIISEICDIKVKAKIEGTRNNLATDFSLAMRELNWQPSRSLRDGLAEQVAFIREAGKQ